MPQAGITRKNNYSLQSETKEKFMRHYKVLSYEYSDFEDQEWLDDNEGYTETALLNVTVEDEESGSRYDLYFDGVTVFTAVGNYRHADATNLEPAEDDWIDLYTELTDDCWPLVCDVKTISGPDLSDDDPTLDEQDDILAQVGTGRVRYN